MHGMYSFDFRKGLSLRERLISWLVSIVSFTSRVTSRLCEGAICSGSGNKRAGSPHLKLIAILARLTRDPEQPHPLARRARDELVYIAH
jgi:hypothetical protein